MTPLPKRAEKPHRFLDAHIMTVERALEARSDVLAEEAEKLPADSVRGGVMRLLAEEYRKLAEEMHYW